MRALPILLASALLGIAVAGCGGSSETSSTTRSSSSPIATGYLERDGDKDGDDQSPRVEAGADERTLLAQYPTKPSPAEKRAIVALVRDYYAASVAGEGARACTLVVSELASGLSAQSVQPGSDSNGCAGGMTALLEREHGRLSADDVPTMTIIGVHLKGTLGLVVLGFARMPESQIIVQREGHEWKLGTLVDSYMP